MILIEKDATMNVVISLHIFGIFTPIEESIIIVIMDSKKSSFKKGAKPGFQKGKNL
jgi:hypothetical protein